MKKIQNEKRGIESNNRRIPINAEILLFRRLITTKKTTINIKSCGFINYFILKILFENNITITPTSDAKEIIYPYFKKFSDL